MKKLLLAALAALIIAPAAHAEQRSVPVTCSLAQVAFPGETWSWNWDTDGSLYLWLGRSSAGKTILCIVDSGGKRLHLEISQ